MHPPALADRDARPANVAVAMALPAIEFTRSAVENVSPPSRERT